MLERPDGKVTTGIHVDLSLVYDVAGNDEGYVRLMVQTFLNTMPTNLEKIKRAAADKQWDALYQAAHYIKSSLSIITIGDMLPTAKEIELSARTRQDLDKNDERIERLFFAYKGGELFLRAKLEEDNIK